MAHEPKEDLQQLHDDVARRQYYQKAPQRIGETLSVLMARRGYAQLAAAGERDEAWKSAAGERLAAHSRIGSVRGGVVEITVGNSAVLQELTFRKRELVERIVAALPDQKIRDLRFRIGTL